MESDECLGLVFKTDLQYFFFFFGGNLKLNLTSTKFVNEVSIMFIFVQKNMHIFNLHINQSTTQVV